MLGILPGYRDSGVGFALKRAQWQMVRHQGLDHITWTYDPLLSRNAYLNITKLGAVCDTYRRSEYGDMRDGLNAGLPSDRFQVDWWINTRRVERRLSKRPRRPLKLDDFSKAELEPLYAPHVARQPFGTTQGGAGNWLRPPEHFSPLEGRLILAEIPSDFSALKEADFALARDWRFFTREVFETAFAAGYIATDFVYDAGRSFYVLSHGESTLEQ
jgi:predicted GNAT superfamily acetyltransferase